MVSLAEHLRVLNGVKARWGWGILVPESCVHQLEILSVFSIQQPRAILQRLGLRASSTKSAQSLSC
jgi:hypothetical protein